MNNYTNAARGRDNSLVVIAQVEHHDLTDTIHGYEVPVDPMEDMGCDACQ